MRTDTLRVFPAEQIWKNGDVIGSAYRIEELIGEGGFARVFRATRLADATTVAIKCLGVDREPRPSAIVRFDREIEILKQVQHAALASLIDVVDVGGQRCLVMEYVDGEALSSAMRGQVPFAPSRAVCIAMQVLDALAALHDVGVVHRDVKPDNVLVDARDGAVLVDLGVAMWLELGRDPDLTPRDMVMGTPRYAAPEQLRGERPDARSDQFALGVVLYEMLTGESPFDGSKSMAPESTPPPFAAFVKGLPIALEKTVLRALMYEKEQRFPSCSAMREELRQFGVLS